MKQKFKIILLSGAENSGRETAAHRLIDAHGFIRCGMLDHAKDICTDILDRMQCRSERRFFDDPELQNRLIMDMDDSIFMFQAGAREFPLTYDQFLKQFADLNLNGMHRHIWTCSVKSYITKVITTSPYKGIAVPDFQHPDEYDELRRFSVRYGGIIELISVNLIRPGTMQPEHGPLDNFKFTLGIKNDGTIADLYMKIDKVATGQWQHDRYLHEVKQRQEHGILKQIKDAAEKQKER